MKKLYLNRRYDEMKKTWFLELKSTNEFRCKRKEALFLILFINTSFNEDKLYKLRQEHNVISARTTKQCISIEVIGEDNSNDLMLALQREFQFFQLELRNRWSLSFLLKELICQLRYDVLS